jgi:S-adenosylmethionine hydrolase
VLKVDNFGNLITNLTAEDVPQLLAGSNFKMTIGGKQVTKLAQTYSQGAQNEPFALMGSSGFVEISVNRGNAARVLGAQRGAEVTVELG